MKRKAILVTFEDAQTGEEAALCLREEGFTDKQVNVLGTEFNKNDRTISQGGAKLGTIVGVTASPARVDRAMTILSRFNPAHMDERAAQWPRTRPDTQLTAPQRPR